MSSISHIEWTDATWNPVTGCTRVSPGCDHCYIERTPPFRIGGRAFDKPGIGGTTGVQLHPDRLDQPLRWKKPRRVFVNSLSDLFHDDIPDEFIAEVFAVMAMANAHVFQVLTKRPRRMRNLLDSAAFRDEVINQIHDWHETGAVDPELGELPLPNVWLGVSVENQEWADRRIPLLLETPAAVRFLSCEPLLGPVDLGKAICEYRQDISDRALGRGLLRRFVHAAGCCGQALARRDLHWVIVGGESGPAARPMHPDWARSLRDQCVDADVPFFFKQWGEWAPGFPGTEGWRYIDAIRPDGSRGDLSDPSTTDVYKIGKKRAGRDLDGRTWDEMPEVAVAAT